MHSPKSRAFTLIELLVVITIIGVLVGIALPVFGSVQLSARKTQSLSNMRQLGALTLTYCSDHNSTLPLQGDSAPTWAGAAANTAAENAAWYNAVPWEITGSTAPNMGGQGLADYQNNVSGFYNGKSLFFVPAAKYPSNKLTAPLFAVAFNSKLLGNITSSTGSTEAITSLRLSNISLPAKTCLYLESGLLGETPINTSQSAYNGQAASYASRSVARYNGQTIIVFADGHAAELLGVQVVASTGKAYYPQISTSTASSVGEVLWTVDPTANPNK